MTNRTVLAALAGAWLASVTLVTPVSGMQQEVPVIEQDLEVVIDALGNAAVTATFTLPAEQWRLWNQTYGQNEFLLKRDFEHQFSAVVLRDFKLERDDMNRTAKLSMKGTASAEYRGNGVWEAELEKGVRGTQVSERVWQFSKSTGQGGAILQQNYRITLPEGATGSEQVTGEFGIPVLRYSLEPAGRSPMLPVAAAVLGLLGAGLAAWGLLRRRVPD